MLGHLSKLPTPRPADWGFKVSVCIAVCFGGKVKGQLLGPSGPAHDDALILVTDNRAAFGSFSGEYLTIKGDALWHGWSVMFAGNDVEHAEPIIRNAKDAMRRLGLKKDKSSSIITPEEAALIVDNAYSEQLQAQIENKILRKRGYNTDSFQKLAKNRCTSEVYARVWDQIGKEKFSLTLMVTGHDENGSGHIWLVDGESAPASYNSISFWAIGSGASAALSRIALYLSKHREFTSLEEALYVAVTAKFAAESAENVGRSTSVFINKHWKHEVDSILVGENAVLAMRTHWDTHGVPPVPEDMIKGVRKYLVRQEQFTRKQIAELNKQVAERRRSEVMRSEPQKSKSVR
jgi:hypothetical protein